MHFSVTEGKHHVMTRSLGIAPSDTGLPVEPAGIQAEAPCRVCQSLFIKLVIGQYYSGCKYKSETFCYQKLLVPHLQLLQVSVYRY